MLMHAYIPEAGDVQESLEFPADAEGSCRLFLHPSHSYVNVKVDFWNVLKMKPEASSILGCFTSLGRSFSFLKVVKTNIC